MTSNVQRSFPESIAPITSIEVGVFRFLETHIARETLQKLFEPGKTSLYKQIKFGFKSINKIEKIVEHLPAYYALWLHLVQQSSQEEKNEFCLRSETAVHTHAIFMTLFTMAALAKTCKITMRAYKSFGNRYALFVKEKIPEGGDFHALILGKNDDRAATVKKMMSVGYLAFIFSLGANAIAHIPLTEALVSTSKTAVTCLKEARRIITIFRGVAKWQNEAADKQKLAGMKDEDERNKLLKKLKSKHDKQSFFYAKMGLHMARFTLNLAGTRLIHPFIAIQSAFLNFGKASRSKEDKKLKLQAKEQKTKDKSAELEKPVKIKEKVVKVPTSELTVSTPSRWSSKEYCRILLACAAIMLIAHAVFYKVERLNYCA